LQHQLQHSQFLLINELAGRVCSPASGPSADNAASRFLYLNVFIAGVATAALIYALRLAAVKQYVKAIHDIGPARLLVTARAADVSRSHFLDHIVDASSPLLFVDFLVSDPYHCSVAYRPASLSAALHWLVCTGATLAIVLASALIGCEHADSFDTQHEGECETAAAQWGGLGLAVFVQLSGCIYACSSYFEISWSIQRKLRMLSMFPWALCLALSLAYLVETALCLCLAVLLKPSVAVSTLTLVATPYAYAHVTLVRLLELRRKAQADVKRAQDESSAASAPGESGGASTLTSTRGQGDAHDDDDDEKEPLALSSIAFAVGSGVVVLVGVVSWTLLGITLLAPPDGSNPLSVILPSIATVGAALQRTRAAIKQQEAQVEQKVDKLVKKARTVVKGVGLRKLEEGLSMLEGPSMGKAEGEGAAKRPAASKLPAAKEEQPSVSA